MKLALSNLLACRPILWLQMLGEGGRDLIHPVWEPLEFVHLQPKQTISQAILNAGYVLSPEENVILWAYYMAVSHKDWELPNSRNW